MELTEKCRLYRRLDGEILTERHVQAAWYDRAIRPERLYSMKGECVTVIHPGRWNLGPGPDFKNAILDVGGHRVIGDVEVHLKPGDWVSHSHSGDKAYRNVIAHVTWRGGLPPAGLPKDTVSIGLGRFLTAESGFAPEQIDVTAYPFGRYPAAPRPCFTRLGHDTRLASEVIGAAGAYRLKVKARRISRVLGAPKACRPAREQLFYSDIMNALGYGSSPQGFRKIAEAVPLSNVLAEPENAEAAFFAASQFVDWHCGLHRPANSPRVRLRSAARLFAAGDVLSLLDEHDFSPDNCRRMVAVLCAGGVMGRGRAGALMANVIIPFAIAEGRLLSPPAWIPPEDVSEPVRITAFRLLGRDCNPLTAYASNGLKIQGLLQIHRDYCLKLHPECEFCEVGVAS